MLASLFFVIFLGFYAALAVYVIVSLLRRLRRSEKVKGTAGNEAGDQASVEDEGSPGHKLRAVEVIALLNKPEHKSQKDTQEKVA